MSQFGIGSAQDFFDVIVLPQYREYTDDPMNVRKAVGAIIFTYHLYEWANGEKFTAKHFQRRYGASPNDEANLEVVRKMTNGMKHDLQSISSRIHRGDYAAGDLHSGDFDTSRLVIVKSDGSEVSVPKMLRELIAFWTAQSRQGW